ncbi:Spy/CpxP family protein refolding chaperone [Flavitalea antarctica]
MNSSSRSRRLIVIIIILLLTNIALLAFFLWPKPDGSKNTAGPKPGYGMAETLKREVGLDSQQVRELNRLREEHWKKMKPLFEDLQHTKNEFYQLLKSPETPDSVIDSAASQIAQKQKLVDLQVFQHFRNSRMVCTPDQRPKYDSLVQIIIKRMSGSSRGSNNRKREGENK